MTEPARPESGLLDTSVFVASESGRRLRTELLPTDLVSTVITLAELSAGALAAQDPAARAQRIRTLTEAASLAILEVDSRAAEYWAELRVHLGRSGRRVNVNDLWIAGIALANGLPIVTQDQDFDALADFPGIILIHV